MSHLTDIWRELVRRRLWPVALLLVAAIAAVPLVLAKEPEPTVEAAPPAPAGGGDSDLSEDPIVTAEAVSVRSKGRVVIGRQRDIFASTAKQPKPEKQPDKEAKQSGGGKQDAPKHDAPTPTPAPSGGGGGGASGPSAPAPAPQSAPAPKPKPKPKTYPLYSLKVRFSGDGEGVKGVLARRTALPSDAEPLIIYLGLLDDHKTAEFLVDSTVTAVGDGACHPYPQSCETVRMRKGDTMFFDVHDESGAVGSQFELDLLDINKKQTTDAAKAARSSKRVSLARAASVKRRSSGLGGTSLLPIR